MAKYRNQLPQLSRTFFIGDGGRETALIFKEGVKLPDFCTFHVLNDERLCEWMRNYYRSYINIAKKYNVGIIIETPTWRANPDWIRKLGYSDQDMVNIYRKSVELLSKVRDEYATDNIPIIIDGCIGPRGDGYSPTIIMSADEAEAYHTIQIDIMSKTDVDMITAFTLTYPEEAIGIVRAAKVIGIPIAISFTIGSDGKLPAGQTLKEAIELVDKATQNAPIYYMINCVHPSNVESVLNCDEDWVTRIHGIKGNASKKSHAELDESKELDSGNPVEFGECNRRLLMKHKNLNIFGGCCGTDKRHAEENYKACFGVFN